jgi:hypothetical protein
LDALPLEKYLHGEKYSVLSHEIHSVAPVDGTIFPASTISLARIDSSVLLPYVAGHGSVGAVRLCSETPGISVMRFSDEPIK